MPAGCLSISGSSSPAPHRIRDYHTLHDRLVSGMELVIRILIMVFTNHDDPLSTSHSLSYI